MALPQTEPGTFDNLREQLNAAYVVTTKPTEYGGRKRRADHTDEDWFTNVAYWMSYVDAPLDIDTTNDAQVAAWLRIRDRIRNMLYNAANPGQTWDATLPTWPLPTAPKNWKSGSRFGAKRPAKGTQTRYHTGIDLGAAPGLAVLAPEAGTIVASNTGWEYNPATKKGVKAILMTTDSGKTVLMGGIRFGSATVPDGTRVAAGQKIAEVGVYPKGDSMVHFQLYDRPLTEAQVNARKSWKVGDPAPANLIDPAEYLTAARQNPRLTAVLAVPIQEDIEDGEEAEGTPEGDPATPAVPPVVSGGEVPSPSAPPAPPPASSGGGGVALAGVAVLLALMVFASR